MPRLTIAVALVALVALASVMSYTGFVVVGVLADHLGSGRFLAGLLLGGLFARFPRISNGKLRTVGLLPKAFRRPVMLSLLALCLVSLVSQRNYVPAAFTGFTIAFLVVFPWIKSAVFGSILSRLFSFKGDKSAPNNADDTIIEGEFREKKD